MYTFCLNRQTLDPTPCVVWMLWIGLWSKLGVIFTLITWICAQITSICPTLSLICVYTLVLCWKDVCKYLVLV